MASTNVASGVTLAQSVQDLSPELYNMIFDLVFTPDPAKVLVTSGYKPPHLLAVNRHSRQLFASRYYGSPEGFRFTDAGLFSDWLLKLGQEDIAALQSVELPCNQPNYSARGLRRLECRFKILAAAMTDRLRAAIFSESRF